ncbi:LysR family transcriptional regulator [Marasmitruncus massiliensis]|uniref:LysR family transcriptional regulator n=1 Tax=Marasmitruncus massiliensis TaxID=1944642 RepID=UPI000C7DAE7C|nr:LysR family transcriptional regulator [Marasmitruncus massiliensis]MBE6905612.1 LysR family transcriptional regulator [Oscillospiraceae bacterium]
MNLAYLRYVSEVEKSGSITKAAQNLYMGQPNLSKAIKELEKEIGITIFRRTAKGVETTRKGEEFLAYANTILSQIDELESLYQPKTQHAIQLSLSVPRATYLSSLFAEFVSRLDVKEHMDIHYRETNSMAAANDVSCGESDLGVIRYQVIYESYFVSYLHDLKLTAEPLREFTMQLLMSKEHPLAQLPEVNYHMLGGYTEIVHGDLQVPSLSFSEIAVGAGLESPARRIYVYERGSQFDLLHRVAGSYMWVSPMPKEILDRCGMVTRACPLSKLLNKDVLIFRRGHQFNKVQNRFLAFLREQCSREPVL